MDYNNYKKNYFNQITDQLIDYFIEHFQRPDIQDKIKNKLLDPMIDYIGRRLYPYILMICICFGILVSLLILMIWNK
jgi:hypothetical protein